MAAGRAASHDGLTLEAPVMTMHSPRNPTEHTPVPDGGPEHGPAELPVEPDLGPVLPLPHPEDPGVIQPAI